MGQQQGIFDTDDGEGMWREEKKEGRKINRKENLEQRTIFPSQITSNCSLVLAKGKTEE